MTCNKALDESVLRETAAFISEYASLLSGCGATCIRIEKITRRLADAFRVGFDISIMPTHVYVSVWDDNPAEAVVTVRKTIACGISFNLNAKLSRLSWEVSDNSLGPVSYTHLTLPTNCT